MSLKSLNKFSATYFAISLSVIILFLINFYLPQTPLSLLVTFIALLFLPGFALSNILRVKIKGDSYGQWIINLALGLAFGFGLCFSAIVLGLTIIALAWSYIGLILVLLAVSFILELRKKEWDQVSIDFKLVFKPINILYVLAFAVAILLMVSLIKAGSYFKGGDVNYHLAILNKVISGQALTISNLSYVKHQLNIVYGFPVWHVFLGILAVVTKSSIFAIWKDMALALTALSFIVWFWLCRKLFVTTVMSTMAIIVFMIFSFYWGGGYLFTTLPIPHSLSQVILIPLLVMLVLEFVYKNSENDKSNYPVLVLLMVLVLLFGAIHITSYFYYLFVVVSLAIFNAIFNFRDKSFKSQMGKLLVLFSSSILVILPLAIALELKDQAITRNFLSFNTESYPTDLSSNSFVAYGPFLKYAFIGLPLVLFFLKKYRNLLLILAILLMIPLIYTSSVGLPLIRTLGYVFVKRFIGTLDWSFLVWSLVLGFLILTINRLFMLVKSRALNYIFQSMAVLGLIIAIYLQFKNNWAANLYNYLIANDATLSELDKYHLWIIGALILVYVIVVLLARKNKKIMDVFDFSDPKNPVIVFCLMALISFVLISPNFTAFQTVFKKNHFKYFIRPSLAFSQAKADYYTNWAGGKEVIDYINTKIPPKSIFDTNIAYFILPIAVDQHMPVYYSRADTEHIDLYLPETALQKRLAILKKYNIDYLLVKSPKNGGTPIMENYPEYFEKLFKANHTIYKVNKSKVAADLSDLERKINE